MPLTLTHLTLMLRGGDGTDQGFLPNYDWDCTTKYEVVGLSLIVPPHKSSRNT